MSVTLELRVIGWLVAAVVRLLGLADCCGCRRHRVSLWLAAACRPTYRDVPQTGQSLEPSPAALSCQPEERAYRSDCCPVRPLLIIHRHNDTTDGVRRDIRMFNKR